MKWRCGWREGCIRVSQSEPKPDSSGEALHVGTAAAPVRISPENRPIPHLPVPGVQPDAGLAFGLGPHCSREVAVARWFESLGLEVPRREWEICHRLSPASR